MVSAKPVSFVLVFIPHNLSLFYEDPKNKEKEKSSKSLIGLLHRPASFCAVNHDSRCFTDVYPSKKVKQPTGLCFHQRAEEQICYYSFYNNIYKHFALVISFILLIIRINFLLSVLCLLLQHFYIQSYVLIQSLYHAELIRADLRTFDQQALRKQRPLCPSKSMFDKRTGSIRIRNDNCYALDDSPNILFAQ